MTVSIYSRQAIEALLDSGFPQNTAVISLYDLHGQTPVDYQDKAARLFEVALYDTGWGFNCDAFLPEAPELAAFIDSAVSDGLDIICQCEYGRSRSAGCAAAILEHYEHKGLDIFADYRYSPNHVVYHKVYDALEHLQRTAQTTER